MQLELFSSREVFLAVGAFEIRWYGIMYVLAFGLAWVLLPSLLRYRGLAASREQRLEILTYAFAGVLLGGRLGFVLLYEPGYFLAQPMAVLLLQQGGMASHGGFIGVGIALWLVSLRRHIHYWALLDVVVVLAALGLALGRVGNIINQELFVTLISQWFAVGKNLFVAGLCYWYLRRGAIRSGAVVGVFCIAYSCLRFVDELLRVQHYELVLGLTRGQWYTIPLLLAGLWLFLRREPN